MNELIHDEMDSYNNTSKILVLVLSTIKKLIYELSAIALYCAFNEEDGELWKKYFAHWEQTENRETY